MVCIVYIYTYMHVCIHGFRPHWLSQPTSMDLHLSMAFAGLPHVQGSIGPRFRGISVQPFLDGFVVGFKYVVWYSPAQMRWWQSQLTHGIFFNGFEITIQSYFPCNFGWYLLVYLMFGHTHIINVGFSGSCRTWFSLTSLKVGVPFVTHLGTGQNWSVGRDFRSMWTWTRLEQCLGTVATNLVESTTGELLCG